MIVVIIILSLKYLNQCYPRIFWVAIRNISARLYFLLFMQLKKASNWCSANCYVEQRSLTLNLKYVAFENV